MPTIHGFTKTTKPSGSKVQSFAASKVKVTKISRPSCGISNCKGKVAGLVGHCGLCSVSHCQKHRMPEAHDCTGLEKEKEESRKRQGEKTMKEATKGDAKMVDRI